MTMSPSEILENEHRFIQKVVAAAATVADRLVDGIDQEIDTPRSIVEFMRIYADKCHHGKEEDLLFPALERKEVPMRGCPGGVSSSLVDAGNQAYVALVADVCPGPLYHYHQPVSKTDQKQNVNEQPSQPRRRSRDSQPSEISNARAPPNCGHVPAIHVTKW